ncbi:hypothetical protein Pla163_21850 [Planctomycetes bacterium Pla163]|uniref:DUF58 domain-containing protein n=1 Tax=Rohdeia mirabilis TaxID=2528008 RepID=A0A518D0S3_9BACT|nr:hypothetical protein Pla163_21850 [Planctomycetes bacterium Pla163]
MSRIEPDAEELAEVLAEVRRIAAWSRRRVRSQVAGGYASAFKGTGQEFEQVREYVLGDDPRSVDWNVTARLGRPFVKTFSEERDRGVVFAVHVGPSVDTGIGATSVRRALAAVCAALALTADDRGDRVGAVHFGRRFAHVVPPGRGASHALRIVRDVLALRPADTDGERPVGHLGALERVRRATRRRSLVFVLSDFTEPLDVPAFRAHARRHDLVAIRVVPAELAPGVLRGLVRLGGNDGTHPEIVDADTPAFRAEWERRARGLSARFAEDCRRAGVDHVEVPIPFERDPDALLAPVLELFRTREARR